MNLACAGSAFGSLHGRGTSVSRVQSSCFFCEDLADQANAGKVTRPGNDRGFAARPGLAFTCNHHRFRGAHTRFVSKQDHSERLNVQLIPDTALRRRSLSSKRVAGEGPEAEDARSCSPDRLHKTRTYYKSGAEEDTSRTGTRRPAAAASVSMRAWA